MMGAVVFGYYKNRCITVSGYILWNPQAIMTGEQLDATWLQNAKTVEAAETHEIGLRMPDRDFIPESVFKGKHGKTPTEMHMKTYSLKIKGQIVTGILVYAENWNPPEGCYRVWIA